MEYKTENDISYNIYDKSRKIKKKKYHHIFSKIFQN